MPPFAPALPPGFRDWSQMLTDISACWPWPYSESELGAIGAALGAALGELPPEQGERCIRAVVFVVRQYLAHRATLRRHEGKENPKAEIARAAVAVGQLIASVEGLGNEAHALLDTNVARDGDGRPLASWITLLEAAHAFQDFHSILAPAALKAIEQVQRRGRKRSTDGALQSQLEAVFISAHGGTRPARGWPAFRDACLSPLNSVGVLPVVETKSKAEQLRRTKAHKIRPKRPNL